MTRSPDVTAYTSANDGGLYLRLFSPRVGASLTVQLQGTDVVRDRCAKLGTDLGKVTSAFRARRPLTAAEAGRELGRIAKIGRNFLFGALAAPFEDFHRLAQFLRAACPTWRDRSLPPPLLHCVAELDRYFPWELLPLFEPDATMTDVRDQPGLERAGLAFPGFAAIVERVDPDHIPDSSFLVGWRPLPIRVVYDGSYPGAHEEVGFFRGNGQLFRLEGPYPRDVTDGAAPSLAEQLCDPALGVDGRRTATPDQVVHFACHCAAPTGDTSGFGYRLADENGRLLMVRLDDLADEMMRQHWRRRSRSGDAPGDGGASVAGGSRSPVPKPLVFLNACGTAVMDPASAVSLLRPFHANRNRGVIGTAANVPDRAAAKVSRWFYTDLVRAGAEVGEALHAAKWRLLQDLGNPLGLLYSVHALAALRLTPIPYPRARGSHEGTRHQSLA
ncbi:CHAT domain-containing protein [Plantactinospora sp. GCM10030261]|uniref:CHAT domain-containing protein n=1 Tax=Plantactinospora sp. GCM10030261 TaxID=3273420 RepID=UPI00361163E7